MIIGEWLLMISYILTFFENGVAYDDAIGNVYEKWICENGWSLKLPLDIIIKQSLVL